MKKSRIFIGILVITAVVFAFYFSALSLNFLYADDYSIIKSSLQSPAKYIFVNLFGERGTGGVYRPVTILSVRLNYLLGGINPWGYHLLNVSFHAAIACLIFLIGLFLANNFAFAFGAGLLFSVLPLNAEAVNWIACRGDSLATAFYLLSFYLYAAYSKHKRGWLICLSLLSFALALGSKESAITLPVVLAAYEFLNKDLKLRLKEVGSYFALLVPYFILRYLSLGTLFGGYNIGVKKALASAVLGSLKIFGLVFMPFIQENLLLYFILLPIIIIIFTAFYVLLIKKFHPDKIFYFFSFWVVITLLPVYHILAIGFDLKTSRLLYLPAVGIAWLFSYIVFEVLWKHSNNFKALAVAAFWAFLIYSGYYLIKINEVWTAASDTTRRIQQEVRSIVKEYPVGTRFYFMDIPNDIKGCFIGMPNFDKPFFADNYDIRGYQYNVNETLSKDMPKDPADLRAQVFIYNKRAGKFKKTSLDLVKKYKVPFVRDEYYSRIAFKKWRSFYKPLDQIK